MSKKRLEESFVSPLSRGETLQKIALSLHPNYAARYEKDHECCQEAMKQAKGVLKVIEDCGYVRLAEKVNTKFVVVASNLIWTQPTDINNATLEKAMLSEVHPNVRFEIQEWKGK